MASVAVRNYLSLEVRRASDHYSCCRSDRSCLCVDPVSSCLSGFAVASKKATAKAQRRKARAVGVRPCGGPLRLQ